MKTKKLLFTAIAIIAFIAGAHAQNVNIPDASFKAALVGNASINTNMDTEIQITEASVYSGSIDVSYLNISDLIGIEAFTALTTLDCSWNYITSLNVLSANTALTGLDCSHNQLTSLDVSANTALTGLGCAINQLYNLNVSANTALTGLDCAYNQLTSLNVSANTALTGLDCGHNQLTSLNVSANTALTTLNCSYNLLTSLNVKNGNNMNMTTFYAFDNPNLSCIEVDSAAWSTANWSNYIDATASFSENCSGVGISDNNLSTALQVYPNPTTGAIFLSEKGGVSLSDLSGKLLLEQKNTNQMDISSLPAGIYFLRFGENKQQTFKIIKE